jgi:hypothetical protein
VQAHLVRARDGGVGRPERRRLRLRDLAAKLDRGLQLPSLRQQAGQVVTREQRIGVAIAECRGLACRE